MAKINVSNKTYKELQDFKKAFSGDFTRSMSDDDAVQFFMIMTTLYHKDSRFDLFVSLTASQLTLKRKDTN